LAEKIKKEVDAKTFVECKELEVKEGDLNSPIWIMEVNGEFKVVVDPVMYIKMMKDMNDLLEEVLELKLERAIFNSLPIDYEDVKAIVLKEMKEHPDKNIDEILDKIKLENPNLFYKLDINFEKEE